MVRELGKKGLRCISFAYFPVQADEYYQLIEEQGQAIALQSYIENNAANGRYLMTLGLKDDLRDTIVNDVEYAKTTAGLTVRMVSNDLRETAVKVATKAGILTGIVADVEDEDNLGVP